MRKLTRRAGIISAWLLVSVVSLVLPVFSTLTAHMQEGSRSFPETGKTVQGRFLTYWDSHGGLAQQGYPISSQLQERSATDGKVYTVQYFERAVFELHPENQPPNDVLLSLLGVFLYKQKYPGGAPNQHETTAQRAVLFSVTGKHVGGLFLDYWRDHGGLAQQGFPISEEFTEVSDLDHHPYTVQYFERAVFELHPENGGTPYEVLLSQLGTFHFHQRYNADGTPKPAPADNGTHSPRNSQALSDDFSHSTRVVRQFKGRAERRFTHGSAW